MAFCVQNSLLSKALPFLFINSNNKRLIYLVHNLGHQNKCGLDPYVLEEADVVVRVHYEFLL